MGNSGLKKWSDEGCNGLMLITTTYLLTSTFCPGLRLWAGFPLSPIPPDWPHSYADIRVGRQSPDGAGVLGPTGFCWDLTSGLLPF